MTQIKKTCVFVCFYVYIIPACENQAEEDLKKKEKKIQRRINDLNKRNIKFRKSKGRVKSIDKKRVMA